MIGDSVNIGQRLESSAAAKGCMISESTYVHAKKHVLVSERKEIQVKGKSIKVLAYIVTG
jgi:class 3 adenylate cyclase